MSRTKRTRSDVEPPQAEPKGSVEITPLLWYRCKYNGQERVVKAESEESLHTILKAWGWE